MIASRTFITTPGAATMFHPSLYGVIVLGVKREGIGYTRTLSTPVNQQFFYTAGRIIFDSSLPFNTGEKIWVLYET